MTKLDELQYTLVNVSELYNNFACDLNLFDVCLLILETCRQNEAGSINRLWKSIICEEVIPCQTSSQSVIDFLTMLKQGSVLEEEVIVFGENEAGGNNQKFENGEWIPSLRNRITALGKELFGNGADYTFPLDLIVRELEGLRQAFNKTQEVDTAQPWPAQTVLDVGVPYNMLLESYDSLYMSENNAAAVDIDVATRLQWLASISEVLELWVTAAVSSYGSYQNGDGNSPSSQLTQAVNTGLMQRIYMYKSALEGLAEGNSTATLADERFAKVVEMIRTWR